MPFKSDEQRKAVMAKLRGRGYSGPRSYRPRSQGTPGGSLFDILGVNDPNSPFYNMPSFLQNGPGTGYKPPGTVRLTGGAIYQTPGSDWFIHQPQQGAPNFGNYTGPGVGPYDQVFHLTPEQASWLYTQDTGLWRRIYNMFTQGIDAGGNQGQMQPLGSPGTTKTFESIIASGPQLEYHGVTFYRDITNNNKLTPYDPMRFKGDYNPGNISSQFLNQKKKPRKKKKGPTWLFGGGT